MRSLCLTRLLGRRLYRVFDYPNDADVSYQYNGAGERTQVQDGRGTSTTTYDRRGRMIRSVDADGGIIEYQYDAVGNLIARISPSQSLVYIFDARNRIASVTRTVDGEAPATTTYEYDQVGNRTAMTTGGVRNEYAYDHRHRLTSLLKKTAAGALLLAMNYSLDASGMRTGVEETDASGIVRNVAYAYDATKRLISETIDNRDDANDRIGQWTYDRVGNRLSQTIAIAGASPQTASYAYDANDRLLSESGAVSASYSYDAQGNTLGKQDASGATTYAYDDANRLIEAITPHAALAYAYTADGLRARQTVTAAAGSPITTQYVQDTAYPYAQVIEEYTAEGANPRQLAATFTFADELISQTRYDATGIPATTFVQADGFGSTRWLTDGTGQITDSIDFDAFGNEIARSGTTEVEHLYRGERWDASLAAYDLRARLYTPANGRFLTQDSFAGFASDPRSLHKYAYTHNDPVNGMDPSGHMTMASVGTSLNIASNLYTAASISFNILSGNYAGAGKEILEEVVMSKLSYLRPVAKLSDEAVALFGRIWSKTVRLKLGYARSSTVLRHNMEEILGKAPANHQAHHIVGGAYDEGRQATRILQSQGIDVNSLMNGVFLPACGVSGGLGAIHCGKHARAYEIDVLGRLSPFAGDKTALVNELNRIREDLLAGTMRLNVH